MNRKCVFILAPQLGAERGAVFNQQPVAGRDERDAADINQCPTDDALENFSEGGFAQQIRQRCFGVAHGEFAGGGEKILR